MGHSWPKVPNTLYVIKTPIFPTTYLFKILSSSSSPLPPSFTSSAIFDVFFFEWKSDCATFIVLFHLMILWIYKCRALVPWYQNDSDLCSMQQGVKFTEVWHIICFLLVLLFNITYTNTHKDTQHTQTNRLTTDTPT